MPRAEGHEQAAHRLDSLLHELAWKNESELMGELGPEIVRFQRGIPVVSLGLQRLTRRYMAAGKRVWPNIEKVRGDQAGAWRDEPHLAVVRCPY